MRDIKPPTVIQNGRMTAAQYQRLHYWVRRQLGKPSLCVNCGANEGRFEWSNVSGDYLKDVTDWQRLCVRCHRLTDYKNTCVNGLHKLTEDNVYITPSSGIRQCLLCKMSYRATIYHCKQKVLE